MILTLAMRELRSLFLSPLAWTIIAVLQFILAWVFLGGLDYYLEVYLPRSHAAPNQVGITESVVRGMYDNGFILFMLIIPLITMRVISEERRSKTLALLLSAPISMTEIVIGKYLGVLIFLFLLLSTVSLMPLSLLLFSGLDGQLFASIFLGTFLTMSAFAAIGLYMSSLTSQPIIAAVSTFAVLLLLFIIQIFSELSQGATEITRYLSMLSHDDALFRGIFNTSDVFYFVIIIVTFIVLSIRRLDNDRLQR